MNSDIWLAMKKALSKKFRDFDSVTTEELMKALVKRLDGFCVMANK